MAESAISEIECFNLVSLDPNGLRLGAFSAGWGRGLYRFVASEMCGLAFATIRDNLMLADDPGDMADERHVMEFPGLTDQATILVVDDEAEIRESLCEHLQRSGFTAQGVDSAAAARQWLQSNRTGLVLLDIMMPGEDGLSLCRHLREVDKTPVILLTALTDDTDKIVGLEIGADDYVTKPFNPRELVARIRAVLRRSTDSEASPRQSSNPRFANWSLNPQQSELTRDDGLVVPLSAGEISILIVFLDHIGETLSRDDLMRFSRGRESLAFERTIDNVISRLRKKVEKDPSNPRIIKTVRGGGYRLVSTSD